jgi:hypothetical protein
MLYYSAGILATNHYMEIQEPEPLDAVFFPGYYPALEHVEAKR